MSKYTTTIKNYMTQLFLGMMFNILEFIRLVCACIVSQSVFVDTLYFRMISRRALV